MEGYVPTPWQSKQWYRKRINPKLFNSVGAANNQAIYSTQIRGEARRTKTTFELLTNQFSIKSNQEGFAKAFQPEGKGETDASEGLGQLLKSPVHGEGTTTTAF